MVISRLQFISAIYTSEAVVLNSTDHITCNSTMPYHGILSVVSVNFLGKFRLDDTHFVNCDKRGIKVDRVKIFSFPNDGSAILVVSLVERGTGYV